MATVNVDKIGRSVVQADWLGPKVSDCPAPLRIRQMNRVNPHCGSAMMTALTRLCVVQINQ